MTDLIAEIERRAEAVKNTPQGPDYQAILDDVAAENGVDITELRIAWTDSFLTEPN